MSDRNAYLKRRYGITETKYRELLRRQNNCCGICGRPSESFKIRLAVDHNHKTGEIRGLLCTFCNRRVIGRHTNIELFINAVKYLEQGTGLFVPDRRAKKRRKGRKK